MPAVVEQFLDFDSNGERIVMTITDTGMIHFGNRFETNASMRMDFNRSESIRIALDFFRNYAPLFARAEFKRILKVYHKARKCRVASTSTAFWHYLEGRRPVPRARKWAMIEWV